MEKMSERFAAQINRYEANDTPEQRVRLSHFIWQNQDAILAALRLAESPSIREPTDAMALAAANHLGRPLDEVRMVWKIMAAEALR